MKKSIKYVILILITAMTVFSLIPLHAEIILRKSSSKNIPQEAVDTAESFIKNTLIKVVIPMQYPKQNSF